MTHRKANFSHFGKEQYRRSILPESVVDFVDEQIKQEITLIDLGEFLIRWKFRPITAIKNLFR